MGIEFQIDLSKFRDEFMAELRSLREELANGGKIVEHKGYMAVQSANHHVHISQNGRTCLHSSVDHPLSDAELREMIDLCIKLREHPEEIDTLPNVEEI